MQNSALIAPNILHRMTWHRCCEHCHYVPRGDLLFLLTAFRLRLPRSIRWEKSGSFQGITRLIMPETLKLPHLLPLYGVITGGFPSLQTLFLILCRVYVSYYLSNGSHFAVSLLRHMTREIPSMPYLHGSANFFVCVFSSIIKIVSFRTHVSVKKNLYILCSVVTCKSHNVRFSEILQ